MLDADPSQGQPDSEHPWLHWPVSVRLGVVLRVLGLLLVGVSVAVTQSGCAQHTSSDGSVTTAKWPMRMRVEKATEIVTVEPHPLSFDAATTAVLYGGPMVLDWAGRRIDRATENQSAQ